MFASQKLPVRAYLGAAATFCNEVKSNSALAFSRDLNLSHKSAFVMLHKLREGMAVELEGRVVEVKARLPTWIAAVLLDCRYIPDPYPT